MTNFYNPYHFVPLNHQSAQTTTTFKQVTNGETQATHQWFNKDLLSGSVFIALTNTSPLIIGGQRIDTSKVDFYRQATGSNNANPCEPAIPGNSLRGMIASTVETISDSAMRVFEDKYLTTRKDTNKALSSIGIVRKVDNSWYIEPLVYPVLRGVKERDGNNVLFFRSQKNSNRPNKDVEISKGSLCWEDYIKWCIPAYNQGRVDRRFMGAEKGVKACFHGKLENYVYIKCNKNAFRPEKQMLKANNQRFHLSDRFGKFFLSGIKFTQQNQLLTQAEYEQEKLKSNFNSNNYIRSMLFWVGYTKNSKSSLMSSKRYAYALPYSTEKEALFQQSKLELPESVIHKFEQILQDQEETTLFPLGWKNAKENNLTQVQEGDIYYFDRDRKTGQINELSMSAIWRTEISGGTTHGIIEQSHNEQYLPYGSAARGEGATLSPAELMFGLVEEMPQNKGKNTRTGQALASRISVHDAVVLNNTKLETNYTQLPVLESPRPPSPTMYLHDPMTGKPLGRRDAINPNNQVALNGRKQYLPISQINDIADLESNKGTDAMAIQAQHLPTSSLPSFGFWLDFTNLSKGELDLLLTALGAKNYRENEAFEQRLGMGKPYGCGRAKLEILRLLFKSPHSRYRSLGPAPVYHKECSSINYPDNSLDWLNEIAEKTQHPALTQYLCSETELEQQAFTINTCERLIGEGESLKLFRQLRDPNNLMNSVPVHYPRASNSTEGFKWFVENERAATRKKNPAPIKGLGKLKSSIPLKPLNK